MVQQSGNYQLCAYLRNVFSMSFKERLITNEELAEANLDFGWDKVHVEWSEFDKVAHIKHISTDVQLELNEVWHMDDMEIRHKALEKLNELVRKNKD
jgi:hypothetical protein